MYLRYDFPGVVPRLNHVCYAVLSECFSFVLCLSCVPVEMSCVRFYPNVLRSFCACHAFLSKCPVFDHACCLPPVRQTGRLAICSVPIPPWVGIAIRAFSDVAWLSDLVGSFRACAFLYGDPDGERRGRGGRSRRRGRVRFCVTISALRRFPRGVRWGLRAPKPAPKSHWLSGLSSCDSRRKCVLRGEGLASITKTRPVTNQCRTGRVV